MTVIGIAGHLRAGKDTIAARLALRHGFVRIGFADALKHEVAHTLRRTLLAYAGERGMVVDVDNEHAVLREMLWDRRTPMTRALLQEWGTELRRDQDPDYWVKAWQRAAERFPRVVVPDVRFPNEAAAIRGLGGLLVKAVRPEYRGDGHASEQFAAAWEEWDHVFTNDKAISDLDAAVDAWWLTRMAES